jgi:DNA-binding CsgD family transcriptional regulator
MSNPSNSDAGDHYGPLDARDRPTKREIEVLLLISAGLTAVEISDRLIISAKTVRRHISNIHSKLNASNNPHAVSIALKMGIIDLNDL